MQEKDPKNDKADPKQTPTPTPETVTPDPAPAMSADWLEESANPKGLKTTSKDQ